MASYLVLPISNLVSFFYWVRKIFIWMQDNFSKVEKIVGKKNVFLQKKADNNMCWAHKWQCSLKENGDKTKEVHSKSERDGRNIMVTKPGKMIG